MQARAKADSESWARVTLSTGDPANLVMLDSTLARAAVMIGGIWIG